jgi:integrase
MTLDEYFEKWLEEYAKFHHSPGWLTTDRHMYAKFVKPVIGQRLLREIQPLNIQHVLQKMVKEGKAKSYANRIRVMLHKMFAEALTTYRYVTYNPVSAVKPFKEDPYHAPHLKQDEAKALLKWAPSHWSGLGIDLALQLGLREGEIVGLKWDAVDLEQRRMEIRRKFERKTKVLEEFTKGKKVRVLGIYPDGLLERLKQQRAKYPKAEFVVCKEDGSMISYIAIINALKYGIRDCKLSYVTVHGLRHTYASLYMQNGGDLYDLQKVMGHQSAKTTERYRHTDPDYLRSKCNVFSLYDVEPNVVEQNSAQTPPTEKKPMLRLVEGGF